VLEKTAQNVHQTQMHVSSYCGSSICKLCQNRSDTKKKRLYDHLNKGMQNPTNNPMLVWMLMNNTIAKAKCRSREDPDIYFLRERLSADERRIALLEMKVELLSHCFVKLIKMNGL